MVRAKQVADLITLARLLAGISIVWVGISRGGDGLSSVIWLMILNWTGDILDGSIARRSRPFFHTWIGDHDLEVDMAVAAGLLFYLFLAGFADAVPAVAYLIVWALLLVWLRGVPRSLGMLFQAPIYGWFIWVAVRQEPKTGLLLPAWILGIVAVTWPRFPREVVPGFLAGLRGTGRKGIGPSRNTLRGRRAPDGI